MDIAWQSLIGFSDRMEVIQTLAAAIQSSSTVASKGEAVREARKEESKIWNLASSKEAYESLVSAFVNHHRKPIPSEESGDRFSLPDGPVQSIGQYEHAVRIYDGLFSSIFCSKPLPGDTRYLLLALKVTPFCGVSPPHDPFREARILAQIPPHSNILPILDKFNIPDNFVLLTPHYPFHLAGSLEKGVINDESGLSIMRDVFCGLAHIHALDIIHRDIKPSNILLKSATGGAVIADFGIAWKEGDPSSEKSEEKISDIGTTCYRAPELLFGYHSYGPSADMWAAGCVFAEVMDVEHRPLFEAGDLGSELRLLSDMFQKIGTPTTESWPEAGNFPDFGKLQFVHHEPKPWSVLLKTENALALDLMQKLVVYQSTNRLTASQAMHHDIFFHPQNTQA